MKTLAIALCIFLQSLALNAEEPKEQTDKPRAVGLWLGVMEVGPVKLRMAFEIAGKDDALSGKLVSLDQNAAEVPCESFKLDGDTLTVEMPAISARYTGELGAEGNSIKGQFVQLENPVALDFTRVEKLPTLNRPQHPKSPYEYQEEEVSFRNEAARIELSGSLTLPIDDGPFPAVVLVTGSGPQDRDQTLFEHKPFLVIADHLTRRGTAVLRYDDRGFGRSGGVFAGATTADFAADLHAAIDYLKSRKDVDGKRVGIIEHSEGTVAAQLVAAEHPEDVDFVIFLAGFGVSGEELALSQSADVVHSAGGSKEDIELSTNLMKALVPIAKKSGPTEKIRQELETEAARFIERQEEKVKAGLRGSEGVVASRLIDPWVRFFLNYDTERTLRRITCPVLALGGSADVQVRSKDNLRAIEKALRAGGNQNVETVELKDLNHLFRFLTGICG